jgi:hypothetical protein
MKRAVFCPEDIVLSGHLETIHQPGDHQAVPGRQDLLIALGLIFSFSQKFFRLPQQPPNLSRHAVHLKLLLLSDYTLAFLKFCGHPNRRKRSGPAQISLI